MQQEDSPADSIYTGAASREVLIPGHARFWYVFTFPPPGVVFHAWIFYRCVSSANVPLCIRATPSACSGLQL